MAKTKVVAGKSTEIQSAPCAFSLFVIRVKKAARFLSDGVPFYYKGRHECNILGVYFDPWTGSPMFSCFKDDSPFSMSCSEVYNDVETCSRLYSDCLNIISNHQ